MVSISLHLVARPTRSAPTITVGTQGLLRRWLRNENGLATQLGVDERQYEKLFDPRVQTAPPQFIERAAKVCGKAGMLRAALDQHRNEGEFPGTSTLADNATSVESLERAFEADSRLSRYEVLLDRLVVYMWAKPGGSKFSFSFRPRFGINAQTPVSAIYDYYNLQSPYSSHRHFHWVPKKHPSMPWRRRDF
jgi:hypothetical protein